jgi:outer membrane lipoprotein-sorting protein
MVGLVGCVLSLSPSSAGTPSAPPAIDSLHGGAKLSALIDRELLLPIVVEYIENDGDSTRYEFHHLELDPQLEESRFVLELSDEVTLHTLDATSGLG